MLAFLFFSRINCHYFYHECQVLEKALEVWDLEVIPWDSPAAEPSQCDPELENAFICHLLDHWFCIRKVNGEWYNFNSLYPAPEHLSKFYLSAYLDSLKGAGWSIFLVRGNFPRECPIPATDAANGFGQWLTPDDAKRITKSCNQLQVSSPSEHSNQPSHSEEDDAIALQEEQDLRAAIAASLVDFSSFGSEKAASEVDKGENAEKGGSVKTNSASGLVDDGNSTVHLRAGADEADESREARMPNSASVVKDDENQ
ncbi:Putative ataxin-3 like [Apostasia shenzhenica]|uniref:ubiquitinyl hydrolase 1 n=1 Tax=Apostasia shenzhenica TaxID=1088818 RepID=A0A2I0A8Y0_9ASPA|nr:Putative ataxin-3 like [Apostasia shenzhenica]